MKLDHIAVNSEKTKLLLHDAQENMHRLKALQDFKNIKILQKHTQKETQIKELNRKMS